MAENDWAIVIGINQYKFLPTDDHLKYAVNDAMKVRQFLCEQAKFPQENVLLCCDSPLGASPQHHPNRADLRDLLKYGIQRAKGAHNFWFFYAGHGIVHEHQDFLLPYDGNPRDLEQTAIPISFVTDCLRDCGVANVVLVMDMCRNRTRRGVDEDSRGIGEEMGEQIQKIAKEQGIVTLFSCSRGERSYEIKDLEQGAFTHVLLEGLKQNTTPRALEQYLTDRLPALNGQYGKPIQKPMVIPEPGFKYDRPLLLSCATPSDIQQLALAAMDAELEEQDYEKAKALWWQVIEADRSTQSDRAKARKAIDRINIRINQIADGAYKQQPAVKEDKKESEHPRELKRPQESEGQLQGQTKQVVPTERQADEQERKRKYQENLHQYEQEFKRAIEARYPIDSFVRDGLNQLQQSLELSDGDVTRIEALLVAPKKAAYEKRLADEQQKPVQKTKPDQIPIAKELASKKSIDYTKLRNLLQAGRWKAADQETADCMCQVMRRQEEGWLSVKDIENFPCADLRTIDQLWVKHSQGKFGFSVQKKIWQECGTNWVKFGEAVGWKTVGSSHKLGYDWKKASEFIFDTSAPKGHLPTSGDFYGRKDPSKLLITHNLENIFSRIKTCKLWNLIA
jgi:uncharacterized caspase-like protein